MVHVITRHSIVQMVVLMDSAILADQMQIVLMRIIVQIVMGVSQTVVQIIVLVIIIIITVHVQMNFV